MLKKLIFKSVQLILLSIFFIFLTQDSNSDKSDSSISISDGKIVDKNDSDIIGSLKIKNHTSTNFNKLILATELYFKITNNQNDLINNDISEIKLSPNEEKSITFSHDVNQIIPEGKYFIKLILYSEKFEILSQSVVDIDNLGDGKYFLHLDRFNNNSNEPLVSVSDYKVTPTQSNIIQLKVQNIGIQNIRAKVKAERYLASKSYLNGPESVDTSVEEYLFKAGTSGVYDISLKPFQTPDKYFVNLSFVDEVGTPVSGIIKKQFTVEEIKSQISEQIFSYQNNKINIHNIVNITQDKLNKNLKININILNSKGSQIYKNSQNLNKTYVSDIISFKNIAVNQNETITINASIIENNTPIANYSQKYKVKDIINESKNNKNKEFKDISNSKYEIYINYLSKKNVLKGYSNQMFNPKGYITRTEFSALLNQFILKRNLLKENNDYLELFKDEINNMPWGTEYIKTAIKANLIKGYPNKTLLPDEHISYAEIFTICTKLLKPEEDIPFDLWPDEYINEANKLHLTDGIKFKPRTKAIREDVARIIFNLYSKQ